MNNINQLTAAIRSSDTPPVASMHEVVMKKEELLKALIENKAKHDAIFEAAVAGYWDTAKEAIATKRNELSIAIKEFTEDVEIQFGRTEKKIDAKEILPTALAVKSLQWNSYLNLVYPENHTKDYERAIRMMSASIYDEVRLSEQEFDQYVLNNWEWKNKFITSNSFYVDKAKGLQYVTTTGCYLPNTEYGNAYDAIKLRSASNVLLSGCAIF